jgi:hypothetical protein
VGSSYVAGQSGGSGPELPLKYAWGLQRVWSQVAAVGLKARVNRARNVGLVLGVLAVQAGSAGRGLAVGAGVSVALVPLARRGASREAVRAWTRAWSVSEALKSEVFTYTAGGSAYVDGVRDRMLGVQTNDIIESVSDLAGATAGIKPEPDGRPLPTVNDIDSYLDKRVDGQVGGNYRPKAALYARRLGWLRRIEAPLGAAGVVLAVVCV